MVPRISIAYVCQLYKVVSSLIQDPPGPPSAPEASEVTKESCVLSWQPPTEDGGTPITGYLVERCTVPNARWLRITKEPVVDSTFKVTQLIEDTQYEFRVIALNKVGESPPGPKSEPVLAKDPWGM